MRPPEFTGGNEADARGVRRCALRASSFNEAAGIHRRKRRQDRHQAIRTALRASMRPPEFTGGNGNPPGNLSHGSYQILRVASMRPPEFTGGNFCYIPFTVYLPYLNASMRPPEFTGGN